jgi:hypothetical protein
MEMICFEHWTTVERQTDSSTPRFPGLPGLCLRLPSSRQCLNPRPTRPTPPSLQEGRDADDMSSRVADPQTRSFITGHRIEHLTSASKGIGHPDVGNLKQHSELVQRIFQGRSDLAATHVLNRFLLTVTLGRPTIIMSFIVSLRASKWTKDLEVFSTGTASVSER